MKWPLRYHEIATLGRRLKRASGPDFYPGRMHLL
jgi:hypothetical protein